MKSQCALFQIGFSWNYLQPPVSVTCFHYLIFYTWCSYQVFQGWPHHWYPCVYMELHTVRATIHWCVWFIYYPVWINTVFISTYTVLAWVLSTLEPQQYCNCFYEVSTVIKVIYGFLLKNCVNSLCLWWHQAFLNMISLILLANHVSNGCDSLYRCKYLKFNFKQVFQNLCLSTTYV